jgi:hypothetical protein
VEYGRRGMCGFMVQLEHRVCYPPPRENLNDHEIEDRTISLTEEARGGTDRVGVAND